jgi:hypothetical protein
MLIVVIGKKKTSFLCQKIESGDIVFDNFGVGLHPTYVQKLIHNLLQLDLEAQDIYLGTNDYLVVKMFSLLATKNDWLKVLLYDSDSHNCPAVKHFSDNSLIDFSIGIYKQEIDLHG